MTTSVASRGAAGITRSGALLTLAILAGCATGGAGGASQTEALSSTEASLNLASSEPSSAAGASSEVDVCGLLSQAEVEAVVGMPVGAPETEEPTPPFSGCRYEEPEVTPVITVGVLAWADATDAASSFDFGADQYPAVDGIGDRAFRSQPIDDITVLQGRYEVSVGLYFVSEDDDADFEFARQLAEIVIGRLP